MARIAINAVVYVAAYTTVSRVGRGSGMALGALENRIVAGIGVARRADALGIAMGN
jgi:hypothetical protein